MSRMNLGEFDNSWYRPGSRFKLIAWYLVNVFFFKTSFPFPSKFKALILTCFGGSVGKSVVIKPRVSIKYPWLLEIGDNSWVGEDVWIDNLANVTIGNNVCLSQGSFLLTGSHDYKKPSFDLILGEIILEDSVWIGAKSVVCPKVTCKVGSVLSVSSVATRDLESNKIYQGNPAVAKRLR